ncbi:MAG: hypothetical protein RR839_00560 [Oscillospiraceae bacterium]
MRNTHKPKKTSRERIVRLSRDYTADEIQNFNKRFAKGRLTLEEDNIRKIVERAYNALPKALKAYESNKTARINNAIHTIIASGTMGNFKPKTAFRQSLEAERKMTGYGTKKLLYTEFRTGMFSNVYNAYNTYVYRLGFSSAKYFYDNAEISQSGSVIEATVKLPPKSNGTSYDILYLEYNFSGDVGLTDAYMA